MDRIAVTDRLAIDPDEIEWRFVRSAGPGGQHVNKASTAVQLRFPIRHSSLPESVRDRLEVLAGHRVNRSGELILAASNHRSQARNRQEALRKLVDLVRRAARPPPPPRRKKRPSRAAKRRRVESKRRQKEKKRLRKPPRG